jgi:4-amino-4-deoxy-L-arabinose transferase-like glycosyltransferase
MISDARTRQPHVDLSAPPGARSLLVSAATSPLAVIAAVTLWRALVAWMTPVAQDEAYYYDWSQALAWGYFDHPPAVALLGLGQLLLPGSAFAARLGALLLSTLTLLVLWRFYRACGIRREPLLSLTLLLAAATFPGLISGVLTTPDTVLALFWVLALHEALAALSGQRRRWLTAGVATGLGLLGKYTMLMIGPVFLIGLLVADRRALRTPWPYLGGLAALLVFLPNLIWNAQHDWLTLRFQFGHGFMADTGAISLPAERLLGAPAATSGEHADAAALDSGARLTGVGSFAAVQLLFWGLPLLVALAAPITGARWTRSLARLRECLSTPGLVLLGAAALVPLLLFGSIAAGSPVEPNWAALYIVGAAPLLAAAVQPLLRWAVAGAATNALLLSIYAAHAATAALPLPHAADRVLRETNGYPALAAHVAGVEGPIFVDRYQTAAMLNFYGAGTRATQWPGLTRPSEYGLGRIVPIPDLATLRETGFTLVAWKYALPEIPGFRMTTAETLFDCRGAPLHLVPDIAWPDASPCGEDWLHIWRVLRYEAAAAPAVGGDEAPRRQDPPTASAVSGAPHG